MKNDVIPEGCRVDAKGRFVPEDMIKPIDLTRDSLVQEIIAGFQEDHARLRARKVKTFNDIYAFVDLSAQEYGVNIGGVKGNITLMSFDGKLKVVLQVQETIRFDERLQTAKKLIDECLTEWKENARAELCIIANDAFKVDRAGNIRTGQVLGLRRHAIKDERWLRAMQAIAEAVQVVGSKSYVRAYERNADGDFQAITLDFAAV
ncbi:DUF3164 family protein [Stenotrophomonas sp. PS02298]|uniref:DUF3164 family protein n=1 Tax=Stenotrophomonas sp. PS02298 TaxID=2991424 RepID=UPI00249A4CFA|nr:DUF3164 family protein [Stenotrophomonas sp. PS02298]